MKALVKKFLKAQLMVRQMDTWNQLMSVRH
jgi:hypothetical protein